MRHTLYLLFILCLVLPACSKATPIETQSQLPLPGSTDTPLVAIFQPPVDLRTATPSPFIGLNIAAPISATAVLTATPTLTPTIITTASLTVTGIVASPPLLTATPEQPSFMKKDDPPFMKKDPGSEPCG